MMQWLHKIEYQIVIDEKVRVIEIKTKMLQWYWFCGVLALKQQILQHLLRKLAS